MSHKFKAGDIVKINQNTIRSNQIGQIIEIVDHTHPFKIQFTDGIYYCFNEEEITIVFSNTLNTFNKPPITRVKPQFPCLMKCDMEDNKCVVVLFDSEYSGMVIRSDVVGHTVGTYSKYWDINNFDVYDEEIILKN